MSGGPSFGEDDLQALIDGRLPESRLAMAEAFLDQHPELLARVRADRRLRDSLRLQFERMLAAPIPARLQIARLRAAQRRRRCIAALATAIFLFGASLGWIAAKL